MKTFEEKWKKNTVMAILILLMASTIGLDSFASCEIYANESEVVVFEREYYVSDDYGQDTNHGTQEAPFKTLEKALESAEDHTMIYILDDIEVSDAENNDAPLVIEKQITIEGNADVLPTISLRAGGIVLGADVTFQNIKVGTEGFLRPGIAANGHTLKMVNIQQNTENLRPLQIYGGTFFDYSEDGFSEGIDYGENVRGTKSNIIIEGGKYEAIYAGSINGSIDIPVEINVTKGKGLTLEKGIYAGSTMKNPQDYTTSGQIPGLEKGIELHGTVDIEIKDYNHGGRRIDGVNETHNVNLSTSGTGMYSFIVENLDGLTVKNGTFVPAIGSSFGTIENNIPDVELIGSSDNKATLDLSGYVSGECEIMVNEFIGSENAILILASDTLLTIRGGLWGSPTEFRASDKAVSAAYWRSEEEPGYSGWIEYGTQYINSSQGDGSFVITNPYFTQEDIKFTKNSSAINGFTTITEGEEEFVPPQLSDFTLFSKEVSDSELHTNGVRIDVETVFAEDEEWPYLEYVPFEYQVTYTDAEGNEKSYARQSSESDNDGYFQCRYTASTETDSDADVWMIFEPIGENSIYIYSGNTPLAAGIYRICVMLESAESILEKSCTITVVSDQPVEKEKAEQEPLKLMVNQKTENENPIFLRYGDEITLAVTGGSGSGEVTYEIISENVEAVIEGNVLIATKAGEITIIAHKAGDEVYHEVSALPQTILIYTDCILKTDCVDYILEQNMDCSVEIFANGNIFAKLVDDKGRELDVQDYVLTEDNTLILKSTYLDSLEEGEYIFTIYMNPQGVETTEFSLRYPFVVNVSAKVPAVTKIFTDVYTDWYTDYVQYVYDTGLMTGIKGTTEFRPNANITKAQVAQVLYNMEGQPETSSQDVFTELKDVYSSEWYANAVAWAFHTGVVTGDLNSKMFNPNADVSREQLAIMMYRYAVYKEYDVSASSDLKGFQNAENTANWALDGVRWAVGSGLISGIEKNGVKDLAPQGNATRAQMAAILMRFRAIS